MRFKRLLASLIAGIIALGILDVYHPNPRGHDAVADEIANETAKRGWLTR